MKNFKLLITLIVLSTSFLYGQNVGINNNNPSEELDVNGNINLTGEFKLNGTAGQYGQILQANGSGTMQWVNMNEYRNFKGFSNNSTWTVPTGVSKFMVEMWGGGGGGSRGGGGGAGGYIRATRSVTAGTSVSITIGGGGLNSSATAANGGNTVVVAGSGTATAFGGDGASSTSSGDPSSIPSATSSWSFIARAVMEVLLPLLTMLKGQLETLL